MPDAPPHTPTDVPGGSAKPSRDRSSHRWSWVVGAAVVVLAVVAALLVRSAVPGDDQAERPTTPGSSGAVLPRDYPFAADSVWRADVSSAPVAASSAAQVADVAAQVADHFGGVAAFNAKRFQVAFYTVPPTQEKTDVLWNDCQEKGYQPTGLLGEGGQFTGVPVPADAEPAVGTDGQLTIYSPATDQLWELWKAQRLPDGRWQACWGGRIDHVSQSPGYFTRGFGSSATGLAVAGGMVWVDDVRNGVIDHALSLQLLDTRHWKTFSWPAQRSDGQNRSPDAVEEGTRFRLDPDLDVESLGLSPIAQMIAKAAQTYGFIVTDRAGSVSISAESGQETSSEPEAWSSLLDGDETWEVMKGFPWADLQALPKDYGKPAAKGRAPTTSSTSTGR